MNTHTTMKYIRILSVLAALTLVSACGSKPPAETDPSLSTGTETSSTAADEPVLPAPEEEPPFPVITEDVHVTIPGMKDEVKLAFLSDLHITVSNDEIEDSEKENVIFRHDSFVNGDVTSQEQCPSWMSILNDTGADYVLFGGDLVDFASNANLEVLKNGLENLSIPFMYIRADHDTEPFYLRDKDYEHCIELQKGLCEYSDVLVKEFPDFVIIGWNNSTIQLTKEGLEVIEKTLDTGKPAILLTHVPIEPSADSSLEEASRKTYMGKSLLWGFGHNEQAPNEYTSQLLEMIYADDTPFVEILAGHLHFSWDGNVSEKVHEHVFGPAFYGYTGMITVSGAQ